MYIHILFTQITILLQCQPQINRIHQSHQYLAMLIAQIGRGLHHNAAYYRNWCTHNLHSSSTFETCFKQLILVELTEIHWTWNRYDWLQFNAIFIRLSCHDNPDKLVSMTNYTFKWTLLSVVSSLSWCQSNLDTDTTTSACSVARELTEWFTDKSICGQPIRQFVD